MSVQKLKSAEYLDKAKSPEFKQDAARVQCQHLAFDALISVLFSILIIGLGLFALLCFIFR